MVEATYSPRERARQARREAILEAAEAVFGERGYAGATMVEIATRSGYSAGNLYNLFESKEDLFREVLTTTGALLVQRILGARSKEQPFIELVECVTREVFGFVEEHRAFIAIYFEATLHTHWEPERFGEKFVQLRTTLEDELEKDLAKAIQAGEVVQISRGVSAAIILGTLHRYIDRWIQDDRPVEDLWREFDELVAALGRAIGSSDQNRNQKEGSR